MTTLPTVVIATFDSYKYSTRSRKAAQAYLEAGYRVKFVGMSAAGRTGRWDKPGRFTRDGVDVVQVSMRHPDMRPSKATIARNIALSYVPALTRMANELVRTPANIVHVTSTPLAALGVAHKAIRRSNFVLDVTERPGTVAVKGSAFSAYAKVETSLMKALSRVVDVATVVVPGDVGPLHHKGFRQVALVRNAPSSSWRSPWEPLPTGPTRFVLVGSIFEGRGIENLIQAAHLLQDDIQIDIYGRGRPDYMQALKEMSATGPAEDVINWRGEIAPDRVSATYLSAHVGLVLYDPTIPGNDGLSNKIMECISTGRPVLAGDLPENRAFVSQHGVGWLTDLSPDNMARTMREIHASPDSLKANADRAREFGRNELTWESEFDNLLLKLSN